MIPRGWQDATDLTTDVVVVGTGPGGSAVGRVLAEAGARVVLLEEGPPTPRFRANQAHTNRYHMQEGGTMLAHGSGIMPIAAGRGVGGGSLVNSALSFRTPRHVLDGWSTVLDTDRYAADALTPIFEEIEALLGIGITPDAVAGENNRIIVRGVQALGLPGGLAPRNTPGCVGCGLCNQGCPSGGKASVDRVLIPMAQRRGAIVQADAKVVDVLVEGDRVVGVVASIHHTDTREHIRDITVRADKVVLSAGAVGTPRLLHHCGLARRMGPVGEGLHVHPGNGILGLRDEPVHMWRGATQGAYFEDPDLPGILPHTLSAPPGVGMMSLGLVGFEGKDAIEMLPHLCGAVVMVSDKGSGSVGATKDGRAKITYHFSEDDLARVKRGMVRTAEVLKAGGAQRLFAGVHGVGIHERVEDLERALMPRTLDDILLYAAHPMSTCRMGSGPDDSVLRPDGRAHRIENLYVADASVFPTSLGVNPQLTTMTVATRIAQGIAG